MKNFFITSLLLILSVIYVGVRIYHFHNTPTTLTNDTDTYIETAKLAITEPEFWNGIRPVTMPFLIKIFNFNWNLLVTFQFTVSVAAWLLLAFMLSKTIELPAIKIFSFGFLLLFSLSTDIVLWDRIVQTESLNLSIWATLVSIFLARINGAFKTPTFLVFLIIMLWAFLRDTNAWLLLFLAAIATGYLILSRAHLKQYLKPAFLIVLFMLSNFSANAGNRWVVPFLNVLSVRILPREDYLKEFEVRGMPITLTLMEQEGITFSEEYINNPELENFSKWLLSNGKNSYMKFLLRHPAYLVQAPFENWTLLFGFLPDHQGTRNDNLDYAPENFKEIIPYPWGEILYPKEFGLATVLVSLIITGLILSQENLLKKEPIFAFILALLLSSYPMLILNYHGDASGIARHALAAILQIILASWFFILIYLDKFLNKQALLSVKNIT
jgi:hypothetical protein